MTDADEMAAIVRFDDARTQLELQNRCMDQDTYVIALHAITASEARVAELEQALEPFARVQPHKNEPGGFAILIPVTVADVRRASAALKPKQSH